MKTKLVLGCIICLLASSSALAQLIGYWPLDGNATASVGSNGTLAGSPTGTTDRFGNANGALSFNGSNWVELASGGGLNGLSTFSIAFWVKWNGSGQDGASNGQNYGSVTGRQSNSVFSEHVISLTTADPATARIAWHPFNFAEPSLSSISAPGNGVWTHLAITVSGANHTMYIGGSLVASGTLSGTFHNNSAIALSIGAWLPDGSSYSTANMDDFRIYNTALIASEVAAISAVPKPSTYAALAGMAALGYAANSKPKKLV